MVPEKVLKLSAGDISIRPLEQGDLLTLQGWVNDPLIQRRIGISGERTPAMQDAWFAGLQKDEAREVWAICAADNYIGNVSLYSIDHKNRNAGLSIFIGSAETRGKGYGKTALLLILEYAFRDLGLHRVFCKTEAAFKDAVRLYESTGFTREGKMRDHECRDGEFVDKILYGVLENECRIDCRREYAGG